MVQQVPCGLFVRGVQLSRSDGFCTTQEAAALFGIHKSTFHQWRRKHPNFPLARQYSKRMVLFVVDELLEWFDSPQESVKDASYYIKQMARISQSRSVQNGDEDYVDEAELIRDCHLALGIDANVNPSHRAQFIALVEAGVSKAMVTNVLVRLQKKRNLRDSGKTSYLLKCLEEEFKNPTVTRSQNDEDIAVNGNDSCGALEVMQNELRSHQA